MIGLSSAGAMRPRLLAVICTSFAVPAAAAGDERPPPLTIELGGFVQPQVRVRESSDVQPELDGFRLIHARPGLRVARNLGGDLGAEAYLEMDLSPSVQLFDAWIALRGDFTSDAGDAGWRLVLGQQKTPFSREHLVSDGDLQFPEKAQVVTIAPDYQLGLTASANLPFLPMLEASAGIYNGKGRNLGENSDSNPMVVGRLALRPIAPRARRVETALYGDAVEGAASFAWATFDRGDYDETVTWIGLDGFFAWNGLSGYVEWAHVSHSFSAGAPAPDFAAQGFNAQLGWLLPIPGVFENKLEVAARFQEIDRNDTIPIPQPGNENQSVRQYVLALSYYHRKHDLKLQLEAVHVQQIEDRTAAGVDATFPADYVLVQASFKL